MQFLLILSIAAGLGLIPANIAKNKRHSFGLWWFYGWMLFIVAIIHVQFIEDYNSRRIYTYESRTQRESDRKEYETRLLNDGGWQCVCGRVNAGYVSTCACGKNKRDDIMQPSNETSNNQDSMVAEETSNNQDSMVEKFRALKLLLSDGIITQEEFDAKKSNCSIC